MVAMASLPNVGPGRLRAMVRLGDPEATWNRDIISGRIHRYATVRSTMGRDPDLLGAEWARRAPGVDPAEVWRRHVDAGLGVTMLGAPSMPEVLATDLAPPGILFWRGDPDVVAGPTVAIIGTRDCSRYGRDIAFEIGYDLANAGVAVVSGLALGIDGAAHAGALEAGAAPPIGVVGSGLDVVYPRQHHELWGRVADAGVLFSEYPLGAPAEAWHFPSRNRLITALADVVVVVESFERGGSMHTVEHAQRRQRPVMAVPGPVRSAASAGTNHLLSEGASLARDATDVLVQLGFGGAPPRHSAEHRSTPSAGDRPVLDAIGWQAATFEDLLTATGAHMADLSLTLDRLVRDGWVEHRGGWYERIAKPSGR